MIPQAWIEAYLRFLLRRRLAVAAAVAVVTAGFAVAVAGMRLHTDFSDFYPKSRPFTDAYATCRRDGGGSIPACAVRAALRPAPDPYIQTYTEFREMFGSANILSVIVAPKHGDIYTPATLQKIDRVTRRVLHSPGVIPYQVLSIAHPKLRGVSARAGAITLRELYYPTVPATQEDAEHVRFAVHSARGVRGIFTALDDSAAVVHAGFWEEAVDHEALHRHLSALIADETDAEHDIHVTGLPWLYVSVLRYADQVAVVFGATTAALAFLLYAYFRTWTGVWVPIFSGLLSSVWGLGIAVLLGFNLDPLVLVIPIFLTARALSHSVQSIDRYDEEFFRCGDQHQAIVESYSRLFPPAIAAIVTDGIGLLVIAVTPIPLVQKIAVFASFWVVSLFVSVVTLHPIILSFIRPTPRIDHVLRDRRPSPAGIALTLAAALAFGLAAHRAGWPDGRVALVAMLPIGAWVWWRYAERLYARLTRAVIAASSGRSRWVVVGLAAVLLIGGWSLGRTLRVGDLTPGAALLFPDHPHNVGFRLLDEKFLGANQLIVIADAKRPDGLRDAETLWVVDELAAHMGVAPGANQTVTVLDVVKQITRLLRDGDPKWGLVPVDPRQLSQFLAVFTNQIAALDRFVDWSGRYATVMTLFRGHSHAEITAALDHAAAFRPAEFEDRIEVRFAGGLFGILAAVNRAVEHSYWTSLVLIFAVIFLCVYLTYGSWSAAAILMIPVVLSQVAAEALMVLGSIDLNVNSLPVAAAGAGAGVDYGIYLFSRIIDSYDELGALDDAVDRAIATTGKAIIFIATTMIAATIFWWFSDLKFQAEMGLLLAVLMAFNAFAGLVVVPAVVKLLRPAFFTARSPQPARQRASRLAAALRR